MTTSGTQAGMRLLQGKAIAIAGGGPAGLTLARLLQMRGAAVQVYELDASLEARNQGGALDLHPPSGQRALEAAGLIEEFRAQSRPEGQETKVLDKHGTRFVDLKPKDDAVSKPEIDRGALRALLAESLQPGTVSWGRRLQRVGRSAAGRPMLHFEDGMVVEADLLVGCDGAWSKVRPLVCEVQPRYSGITFIESRITDADVRSPAVSKLVGHGAIMITSDNKAIIAQRNADGHIRIYACLREAESWVREQGFEFADPQGVRARLVGYYQGWRGEALEMFWASDDSFVCRPIYTHEPTQAWNPQPDITLAGDAAHVMPPFTGKGVNLAMLDALELAQALADDESHATIADALRTYEAAMMERMKREITAVLQDQDVFISPVAPQGIVELFKQRMANPG